MVFEGIKAAMVPQIFSLLSMMTTLQAYAWLFATVWKGKEPGPLPKGLPPVPDQQPIPWLVVIALCQRNRVQESLAAHGDDTLIIEGHPVVAGDGTHVLLAQTCTSKVQQREKKQTQHPHPAETTH